MLDVGSTRAMAGRRVCLDLRRLRFSFRFRLRRRRRLHGDDFGRLFGLGCDGDRRRWRCGCDWRRCDRRAAATPARRRSAASLRSAAPEALWVQARVQPVGATGVVWRRRSPAWQSACFGVAGGCGQNKIAPNPTSTTAATDAPMIIGMRFLGGASSSSSNTGSPGDDLSRNQPSSPTARLGPVGSPLTARCAAGVFTSTRFGIVGSGLISSAMTMDAVGVEGSGSGRATACSSPETVSSGVVGVRSCGR